MEWVEGSDCSSGWVWLGGRGWLGWEWMNFGPMREPWGGEVGVRVLLGMSVCDRCVLGCMVMALASVDGRGQLDEGRACMLCMGAHGRSECFISPCMSTSSQVSPAGSPNVLKLDMRTDPVAWFCNTWTLGESVRLAWEFVVGSSRGRGLPR